MEPKPKVLLHICCAPDATAVFEQLKENYAVVGFFHNPNIEPASEHEKRRKAALAVGRNMGLEIIFPEYNSEEWLQAVRGLEQEPEKGRRCAVCFEFNLTATARKAKTMHIPLFTTTLSISPHKRIDMIRQAAQKAADKAGVSYLDLDFKKHDGFKRSLILSKEMNIYRQNYCGCRYSLRVTDHA